MNGFTRGVGTTITCLNVLTLASLPIFARDGISPTSTVGSDSRFSTTANLTKTKSSKNLDGLPHPGLDESESKRKEWKPINSEPAYSYTSFDEGSQFLALGNAFMSQVPNPQAYPAMDWRIVNALYGIFRAYEYSGDVRFLNYIRAWADAHLDSNGNFDTQIIDVFPGGLLLEIYKVTNDNRYFQAGLNTRDYLNSAFPRLAGGIFVHTNEDQIWVDTLFGVVRFLIPLAEVLGAQEYLDEAADQLILHADILQDPSTGLFYHGWDQDGSADWADATTHLSPEFWGRGNGWVIASLVDVLEVLPPSHGKRAQLITILNDLTAGLAAAQDQSSGLWYTVLTRPQDSGNYLETSGSALFLYGLQKAIDLGLISSGYQSIVDSGNNGLNSYSYQVINGVHMVTNVSSGTNVGTTQYYYDRPVGTGFQYHFGHGVYLEAKSLQVGPPPPPPEEQTVELNVSTTGFGQILLDPPGGSYTEGQTVSLTATPSIGWQFEGWSGAIAGSQNPVTLTLASDASVTAHFMEISPGEDPPPTAGQMEILINCDDVYELWVNGDYVGANDQWDVAQNYIVPFAEENFIAVKGLNTGGATGLIVEIRVNGSVIHVSDNGWRQHAVEQSGWTNPGFNDNSWTQATDFGSYGASPWGTGIANFPSQSNAHWIWGTGDNVYFSTSFSVDGNNNPPPNDSDPPQTDDYPPQDPPDGNTSTMEIIVNTDDIYELWVNGAYVGSNDQWDVAQSYMVPVSQENVVAVKGTNTGGAAGLIAEIRVNGSIVHVTNNGWRRQSVEQSGWTNPGFNDNSWPAVLEFGQYGVSPWGTRIANFPPQSNARWIWGTGNDVYFRTTFSVGSDSNPPTEDPQPPPEQPPADDSPPDNPPVGDNGTMNIIVNADDIYELWVNGSLIGSNDQWDVAHSYTVPLAEENILAIKAHNTGGPTGLIAEIRANDSIIHVSDQNWRWSPTEQSGWTNPGFGDNDWAPSNDLGQYGASPWGTRIANFPSLSSAHWIWGTGDNVYFRTIFSGNAAGSPPPDSSDSTPEEPPVVDNPPEDPWIDPPAGSAAMELTINTDDGYSLWHNGNFVGENSEWNVAQTYTLSINEVQNVLAVCGRNRGNGARGLIAEARIGETIIFHSNVNWLHHPAEIQGWTGVGFDDSNWSSVNDLGAYGVSPWGHNISGFPSGSSASWIWGNEQIEYFRISFVLEPGSLALISKGDSTAFSQEGFAIRQYELVQNYPNPFNPTTKIGFKLPQDDHVLLRIFDLKGKIVAVLIDGIRTAGFHIVVWSGKDNHGVGLTSGIYFYQLRTNNNHTLTRKMTLLK